MMSQQVMPQIHQAILTLRPARHADIVPLRAANGSHQNAVTSSCFAHGGFEHRSNDCTCKRTVVRFPAEIQSAHRNAVALEFVISIDEVVFDAVVERAWRGTRVLAIH